MPTDTLDPARKELAERLDGMATRAAATGLDECADLLREAASALSAEVPHMSSHGLIDRLAQASEGNVDLDFDIAKVLDPDSLPAYTTSIDAALPGEDIDHVRRTSDGMWWAHDSRLPEDLGYCGHTEALARRIASLRARGMGGAE